MEGWLMAERNRLPTGGMSIAEPVRCGECGAAIEGYTEYAREAVTKADLVPAYPGGPLVPLPPDQRQRPLRIAEPCGHPFHLDVTNR